MLGVARRNPAFRRLWLSQVVSEAGDWLNRIAILALIGNLGGARLGLGLLFGVELATRLLPTALMGPILLLVVAGVVVMIILSTLLPLMNLTSAL